jgi:hypothetical protein
MQDGVDVDENPMSSMSAWNRATCMRRENSPAAAAPAPTLRSASSCAVFGEGLSRAPERAHPSILMSIVGGSRRVLCTVQWETTACNRFSSSTGRPAGTTTRRWIEATRAGGRSVLRYSA